MSQDFECFAVPEQFGQLTACHVAGRNHQMQHAAAYALLRESLPACVPELRLHYNAYGKPYLADYPEFKWNLSHCDGLAVCLLSRLECGVDAEAKRCVRPAIVRRIFTPEEQAQLADSAAPDWFFTKLWTLKEAYIKAIGRGLSFPMREIAFSLRDGHISCNQEHAAFFQIQTGTHVISLCVLTPDTTQSPSYE